MRLSIHKIENQIRDGRVEKVKYIKTLGAFRKAVKVAKREIDEDVGLLAKVMDYYLEIESILKDGKDGK